MMALEYLRAYSAALDDLSTADVRTEIDKASKEWIREWVWDLYLRIWHGIKHGERGTSYDVDAHSVFDDYSRRKIIWYLTEICGMKEDVFKKDFHFVFGHTHHGGRVLEES